MFIVTHVMNSLLIILGVHIRDHSSKTTLTHDDEGAEKTELGFNQH